jgi:hypothetical protein
MVHLLSTAKLSPEIKIVLILVLREERVSGSEKHTSSTYQLPVHTVLVPSLATGRERDGLGSSAPRAIMLVQS